MHLKPIASLGRDEAQELIRVHAKLFAFLQYSRLHPDRDEEEAHAFAARHWGQFREVALDYLAVAIAVREKEALLSN